MNARNARNTAHRLVLALATVVALSGGAACGSRSPYWDLKVDTSHSYGLANGVVLVDDPNHRIVVLTSKADHTLEARSFPLGHGFTGSAATTPDGQSLLLLSSGDWPPKTTSDEPPSLTVVTVSPPTATSPTAASINRYPMSEPLSNIAVDPQPRDPAKPTKPVYAVAYQGAGASSQSFATNPNEIVIFDLSRGPVALDKPMPNPKPRTLRSFGGTPLRLTFSPDLTLPARAAEAGVTATSRRLLFVETNIDVCIVDLSHAFEDPHPPDITVRLTAGTSATQLTPAGLAIDPDPNDGRIALRTVESRNVFTMQLVPAPPPPPGATLNDFTPSLNLTDVGGIPTDAQFVNTSDGLRVAALVPSTHRAVLFEPDTSATTPVDLPAPYSNLSLVTSIVTGATGTMPTTSFDVAMLWTANAASGAGIASGIALWTLDNAVGQPYRSIEVLSVEDPIVSVMDVPPSVMNGKGLKVLTTPPGSTHAFYVLDLVRRTPSPIDTSSHPTISMSPDGLRLWAYASGGTDLAAIDLATLNPTPLTTNTGISSAFDIAAPGPAVDMVLPHTLVALHSVGSFGATTFDALKPQTATSHRDVALLLEAP